MTPAAAPIGQRIVSACAYCGGTEGPFHLDHVVPRSRGGPDTPRNLILACAACNMEKRAKLPSEWLMDVPAEVAAIEARITLEVGGKIRAKRDAKRKAPGPSRYRCYFCAGPVSPKDGFLEFFSQESGPPFRCPKRSRFLADGGRQEVGALAYPGTGAHLVERGAWHGHDTIAVLTHADCGPGGYWFPLDRMRAEGTALRRHVVESKHWGRELPLLVNDAFDMAFDAAGVSP